MLNDRTQTIPHTNVPPKRAPWLRVEWLGQTVASLCWMTSVFVYGIASTGDWLQLGAASAWLMANIASAVTDLQRDGR